MSARWRISTARCGSPASVKASASAIGSGLRDMGSRKRKPSANSRDLGNAGDRERGTCGPAVGKRDAVLLDFEHGVGIALLDRAFERFPIAHLDAFKRRLIEEVGQRADVPA